MTRPTLREVGGAAPFRRLQPMRPPQGGDAARRRAGSDPGHSGRLAGALHQSRTVLARLQPPRSGGGAEHAPPAARAAALSVDLGVEPRRVLHGARRRPQRHGQRGRRHALRRRTDAGPAALARRRDGERADRRSAEDLARAAQRRSPMPASSSSNPTRCRARTASGSTRNSRDQIFPGADAARDRSGASVPVHPQSRLRHGAAPDAQGRRQGADRAASDPVAAAALRAAARPRARRRASSRSRT